jgi:hypothetical protein
MTTSYTTPIDAFVDAQRTMIETTRQTAEQSLEIQRSLSATMADNAIAAGRSLSASGVELSRRTATAWVDAVAAAIEDDEAVHQTVADSFDALDASQEELWASVDEATDESLRAYDELADSERELLEEWAAMAIEAQEAAGEQAAEAVDRTAETVEQAQEQATEAAEELTPEE